MSGVVSLPLNEVILRKKFAKGIHEFISIIENRSIEGMRRGEHETCRLASNLLRRSLENGLSPEVWVGTEIKLDSGRKMDFILVGSDDDGNLTTHILEFKQWTEIEVCGDGYLAKAWGSDYHYHEYNAKEKSTVSIKHPSSGKTYEKREECPHHQLSEYHRQLSAMFPSINIDASLVFPNMLEDTYIHGIKTNVSKNEIKTIYINSTLEILAKNIAALFAAGPSKTQGAKFVDGFAKKHLDGAIVRKGHAAGFIETPKLTSTPMPKPASNRHGWVGGVNEFIQACERNKFAEVFRASSIGERRAIVFSSNHLADTLRKLAHTDSRLAERLCVVLEFKVIGSNRRIDSVLAMNTSDDLALYAIEMKAWSNMFDDFSLKVIPQSTPAGKKLPSKYSYVLKGGKEKPKSHPIEQLNHYVQDLHLEYSKQIEGCAWLHNVHGPLDKDLRNLTLANQITLIKTREKKITIFDHIDGTKKHHLFTQNKSYQPKKADKPQGALLGGILDFFKQFTLASFDLAAMERLTNQNPDLSGFTVEQAFNNSEHIFEERLDTDQKKIANEIIRHVDEIKEGEKVIISVTGDAGTGKTFIALAAMGKILKEMEKPGSTNYPAFVIANNPAAKAISKRCRLSHKDEMDGYAIGSIFIKDRQNFFGNSEYVLANRLKAVHEVESGVAKRDDNIAPVLIFDESQLMSAISDAVPMRALTHDDHSMDIDFLNWLDAKEWRSTTSKKDVRCSIEVLSALSPVTVVFLDERQATRLNAIDNLTIANIEQHVKDEISRGNKVTHIKHSLKKAYRNEHDYMECIKHILYSTPCPLGSFPTHNHQFEVSVANSGSDFVKAYDASKTRYPPGGYSCGLVAGYTKQHISKKEGSTEYDWKEFAGTISNFQWNLTPATNWIHSEEERKERIGYYLAVQGNELDELFVYIGDDLTYDNKGKSVVVNLSNHDPESECVKEKGEATVLLGDKHKQDCIRNQYWVLLTRAKKKVTIFCEDPKLNDFFKKKLEDFGY